MRQETNTLNNGIEEDGTVAQTQKVHLWVQVDGHTERDLQSLSAVVSSPWRGECVRTLQGFTTVGKYKFVFVEEFKKQYIENYKVGAGSFGSVCCGHRIEHLRLIFLTIFLRLIFQTQLL